MEKLSGSYHQSVYSWNYTESVDELGNAIYLTIQSKDSTNGIGIVFSRDTFQVKEYSLHQICDQCS